MTEEEREEIRGNYKRNLAATLALRGQTIEQYHQELDAVAERLKGITNEQAQEALDRRRGGNGNTAIELEAYRRALADFRFATGRCA